MAGVTQPLAVTKGKNTSVTIALLPSGVRTAPNLTALTTGSAASNATTIAVTAAFTAANNSTSSVTSTQIQAGQALLAEDTDGKVYPIRVAANYTSGTSLTVSAMPEPLPAGCTIVFPPEMRLRTNADIESSTAVETVNTFDHSVQGDASPGATDRTLTTNGFYSWYDPGLRTAEYARDNSLEVFVLRILDNPNATEYSVGRKDGGSALVTGVSTAAPNEGSVSADLTFQFTSSTTLDPNPA